MCEHGGNEKLRIEKIREILVEKLSIPPYQRPYRWTVKSALSLFSDTYNGFENKLPEYRIGTIVLHKQDDDLSIVDGLQRLTTIIILLYCIDNTLGSDQNSYKTMLDAVYNELSIQSIRDNYRVLQKKVREIERNSLVGYKKYLLDKCTIVRVETDSEQEAFQFFDSQNTRGKALEPHDLLKAYHLREMRDEEEYKTIEMIERWEAVKQQDLTELYRENLFPVICWYRNRDGLRYSSNDIDVFKGIRGGCRYNYAFYCRAANLFIEQFNNSGSYELTSERRIEQFQLTQPIMAGKRFFEYSLYYHKLKNLIVERIKSEYEGKEKELLPEGGAGDKYVRTLLINVLMFYADRFGMESLTKTRMKLFYKWAYSLRLTKRAVYQESVNRYAQGKGEMNRTLNMFTKISEMMVPEDLDMILLDMPERKNVNEHYGSIYNYLEKE